MTGWALRRARTVVAKRANEDPDAFVNELIDDWAYTRADALELDLSVRAWLAIPLIEDGEHGPIVRGIIWIDADDRDFFTEDRVTLAEVASAGIARFVNRRYAIS